MCRKTPTSATRPWLDFRRSTRRSVPGTMLLLALLTACATPDGVTLPPVAATVSAEAATTAADDGTKLDLRPLACSEFKLVIGHAGKITADGKDDVHLPDVQAALALPDWGAQEAQLRRLFGDTSDTLKANAENNASWRALCK